jgi:hypothetical protein
MMGTVWVRLGATEEAIQPFINALVSAFLATDGELGLER